MRTSKYISCIFIELLINYQGSETIIHQMLNTGIQFWKTYIFLFMLPRICFTYKIFIQLPNMGKQSKKQAKKGFPLLTTAQSEAYKQQLNKQGKTLLAGSDIKMERLMQTNPDPNYLSIFKKQYNPIKQTHRLDELEDNQYNYDPKAHRDRHFHKKREAETKVAFNAPVTTNQQYGWRAPIDIFPTNFGMKQTFDESLMVALKGDKQKK